MGIYGEDKLEVIGKSQRVGLRVVDADVFNYGLDVIMHQANCRMTMGAGIANVIRKRYPGAYRADLDFIEPKGSARLGKYSWALVEKGNLYIVNLYGQDNFRGVGVLTEYDKLEEAVRGAFSMLSKEKGFKELKIGIPHGLGCGLARGDWGRVSEIFDTVSKEYGTVIYACKK